MDSQTVEAIGIKEDAVLFMVKRLDYDEKEAADQGVQVKIESTPSKCFAHISSSMSSDVLW